MELMERSTTDAQLRSLAALARDLPNATFEHYLTDALGNIWFEAVFLPEDDREWWWMEPGIGQVEVIALMCKPDGEIVKVKGW